MPPNRRSVICGQMAVIVRVRLSVLSGQTLAADEGSVQSAASHHGNKSSDSGSNEQVSWQIRLLANFQMVQKRAYRS